MKPVQGAHEVVTARYFLGRHKQDLDGRGVPAQALQQLPGFAVLLSATQVATGYAGLLQVEHLQPMYNIQDMRSSSPGTAQVAAELYRLL